MHDVLRRADPQIERDTPVLVLAHDGSPSPDAEWETSIVCSTTLWIQNTTIPYFAPLKSLPISNCLTSGIVEHPGRQRAFPRALEICGADGCFRLRLKDCPSLRNPPTRDRVRNAPRNVTRSPDEPANARAGAALHHRSHRRHARLGTR